MIIIRGVKNGKFVNFEILNFKCEKKKKRKKKKRKTEKREIKEIKEMVRRTIGVI